MKCAWNELLNILPLWIRQDVDRLGKHDGQELRLRLGHGAELITGNGDYFLQREVRGEDLQFCINMASQYSPWAAESIRQGFLTAPGGHRIGLCGEAVMKNGEMTGIRNISSLCIRIARDFPGIAGQAPNGSILILGPPGSGKTTLLRDLIRIKSNQRRNHVAVVDERGELFPPGNCFDAGVRTDVITGCPKSQGIDTVLRTMGPTCIAVDEITSEQDTLALIHAAFCGVKLLATAHAESIYDLKRRPVYRKLLESAVFDHVLLLQSDKSWKQERIKL